MTTKSNASAKTAAADEHVGEVVGGTDGGPARGNAARAAPANDNARAIVMVGGYAMSAAFPDGEARIRDVELAARLEYAEPRMIRLLIKRLIKAKKLNNVVQSYEAQHRADGMPSKPATVYWLTEAQALKVIAKSETAKADGILDEVIAVFVEWRHGRLALATAPDARVLEAIAELRQQMVTMGTVIESLRVGTISREDLNQLRADVKRIALLEVAAKNWHLKSAATRDIYSEVGQGCSWGGKGQSWKFLPASKVQMAFLILRNRETSVRRAMRLAAEQRQVELPFAEAKLGVPTKLKPTPKS